jgi:hypothetical protein
MDTKLFARKQPGGMLTITDRSKHPSGDIWWVDSGNTMGADHGARGRGYQRLLGD